VRLVVEIERIGNEFVEIHVGRTIATGAIATGSAGTARATISATAGSTTTVSAGAATTIVTARAAALATTAATTWTAFAGWTILAAGFAFFGFFLFCFRHDF
jgi:hypothetical protein